MSGENTGDATVYEAYRRTLVKALGATSVALGAGGIGAMSASQPAAAATSAIDHFDDGDLSEYTVYGGSASITSSPTYSGSGALKIAGDSSDCVSTSGLANYPSAGDNFSTRVRWTSGANALWVVYGLQDTDNHYYVRVDPQNDNIRIKKIEGGSVTSLAYKSSLGLSASTWYEVEIDWATDGTHTVTLYDDTGSKVTQLSATDTTWTSGGVGFYGREGASGATDYFDAAVINSSSGDSTNAINPYHEPTDTYYNILGSRPMVSTEHKTYYVSRTEGDDANSGESKSAPLATIQEVADRVPYMLFHGLEVVLMTHTSGAATADSGGITWPPIWCNFAGSESDILIRGEGTDPNDHVIDSRGISVSIHGQESSAAKFKNIKFDTRPQSYDGIAMFENCIFHSDTDTDQDMAIGGYHSDIVLDQCTFGGDVQYLSQFNQGHRFTLYGCDGTIGTALVDNGGLTAPTVFLDNCSISVPSLVTSTSAPALVIEDGQIAYPSSFK